MSELISEQMSDRELFARLRADEIVAFSILFDRHRAPVYWAAMTTLRSVQDSEEVAADAFLTMWVKRKSITLYGESALPWLLVTAQNLARNRARANRRRPAESIDLFPEPESQGPGTEEQIATDDAIARLRSAVERLEPMDRAIFELCILEDLPYKQAATKLGTTHGSIRNRLSRLRQRLRNDLDLNGGD